MNCLPISLDVYEVDGRTGCYTYILFCILKNFKLNTEGNKIVYLIATYLYVNRFMPIKARPDPRSGVQVKQLT